MIAFMIDHEGKPLSDIDKLLNDVFPGDIGEGKYA